MENSGRPSGGRSNRRRLADAALTDPDALAQLVAEAVAEKLAAQADKVASRVAAQTERAASRAAAQAQRAAAHAAGHGANLQRLVAARDALAVWTRERRGSRRPRFTLDDLAREAIRIADAEGLDALSMRRLATELDAGTMTLYHYVRTKDELLALVNDTVMAETLLPDDEFPVGWREALTAIAGRSRAAILRHPWMFDAADEPSAGPNGLRHFEQSLRAVSSLPIPLADRIEILLAVDEYVFGSCWMARGGLDSADVDAPLVDYVSDLAAGGELPEIARVLDELGIEAAWDLVASVQHDESRFDRNLQRLLDGIEQTLPPHARR